MTETKPTQETATAAMGEPRMYAPWMVVVLIIFIVCECLFMEWGFGAIAFATIGLFASILFAGLRSYKVYRSESGIQILVGLAIIFIFFMLILPSLCMCRESARRVSCSNNLKQLSLGLYNYESTCGHFPPAFVPDEDGKPMHSWRVAILPFIEQETLYDKYDFNKPWDSPENREITELHLHVFRCPSISDEPGRPEDRTDYVAVLGEDTFWRPDGVPRKADEITRGLSSTVALIEINDSDVLWSEPRDIMLDDFLSGKISWLDSGVHSPVSAFYEYPHGRNIVFADGHVHFLVADLTPDQIRRLFSITKPLGLETEFPYPEPRPIVFRHVVFYVWLVTLFLQFIYLFFPARRKINMDELDERDDGVDG